MTRSATSSELVEAVARVVGDVPRPVALHEPLFAGNEDAYVHSCIADGWVSSVGAFVDRFERDLAATCGARHAVAMVNGTGALHLALVVSGVEPGDEVLIPSLTFVATANAVVHAGGVPHFIDVEPGSLGVCPRSLASHLGRVAIRRNGQAFNKDTGRRLRAVMPVHVFGHPCQIDAIAAIASEWGLAVIEDATEALGSQRAGRPVGSEHLAVFSFNGNKIATTGGGGAVTTNDEAIARRLKHLSTTAKQRHAWAFLHDEVAWNYRLPNLNAALGCAQLEQLPRFIEAKRALAAAYEAAFRDVAGARVLPEPAGTRSIYWLVPLLLDEPDAAGLEQHLQAFHDAGLQCRPVWEPLHRLPMYREHPRAALPITENLAARIISLPSSVRLGLTLLAH